MPTYDVIVVGLGAFGSAAVYHLARSGASVLGIDRHSPPHKKGSTHGETRVTRAAIGEGVEYSKLAIRSNTLWRELEAQTGETLFEQCGCLLISGRTGAATAHHVKEFFANVRSAAALHNIALEEFPNGDTICRRFPQFAAVPEEQGLLDPLGGFLFPERCVRAQLELAEESGAALLKKKTVVAYNETDDGVTVSVDSGETYRADRLLLTAGAWLPGLLGSPLDKLFKVTRHVLYWFEITGRAELFDPKRCPTYIWLVDRPSIVYGFPFAGDGSAGIKLADEEDHGAVDPDTVKRDVSEAEIQYMYKTYVEPFFPDIGPRSLRTEVCLYTEVDRARFVIDWLPGKSRILFASPCSGHGFKHSAAVGEALAEMLTAKPASHSDLSEFTLERLKAYG